LSRFNLRESRRGIFNIREKRKTKRERKRGGGRGKGKGRKD
jgi:hypothetical protein